MRLSANDDGLLRSATRVQAGALRRFSYDNQDRLLGEQGTPIGLDGFEFALLFAPGVREGCDPRRRLEVDVVPDGSGPSTYRLLPAEPECRPDVQRLG